MSQTIRVEVTEASQPAEARRRATTLAVGLGFDAEDVTVSVARRGEASG